MVIIREMKETKVLHIIAATGFASRKQFNNIFLLLLQTCSDVAATFAPC